mgnify:CR=1 FL=1
MIFLLIYPFQVAYSLVMLVVTSIFDIKSREIPDKLWIPFLPIVVFTYLEHEYVNTFVFVYSVIMSLVVLLALTKLGLMGGADVVLMVLLGLGNPVVRPFFFPRFSLMGGESLTVLIYTSLIIALGGVSNLLRNYSRTKGFDIRTRLVLAYSGKRMKVRDFLNSRFIYPLTVIDDKGNMKLRTTFQVEEDDRVWREKYAELVRKGVLKDDMEIWVTWGVPVIPFFLIGYVLSLFVGLPI